MPGVLLTGDAKKKRKHDAVKSSSKPDRPRKAPKKSDGDSLQTEILTLEEEFLGSQQECFGHLEKLRHIIVRSSIEPEDAILAAVALCRIFCRLIASEQLVKSAHQGHDEAEQVASLRQEMRDYTTSIRRWIGSPDAAKENTAVTLLMRLVKSEALQNLDSGWQSHSTFQMLVRRLVEKDDAEAARQTFIEKYVEEYDDVRYYFFRLIKQITNHEDFDDRHSKNVLELLSHIEGVSESAEDLTDWYGETPPPKHHSLSLSGHRKAAQEAWMVCFRADLTEEERKKMLMIMHDQILPWFSNRLEILTDFITDSFNASSDTAVLAFESMFELMTQRNIDYPEFYTKLYSLLDEDILHSKHRSRFLSLLNKCLDSSHLPATLIASFMKRLSRLALQAPPGAIVWLVPWTYNMLRQHPSCTFMLHRTEHPAHAIYACYPNHTESGMDDPFDMAEKDPVLTTAIDSSLWEMQTLASHYHPNVATLASILSEQFTKREYQLDDFLDHSYSSLLTGELQRNLKKAPEVEWEIPKRIVTTGGEPGKLNALGSLLQAAIDVS